MSSFTTWFGSSDVVEFTYSAAEREGVTEIPDDMFNVPKGSIKLGKVSPASKRLALNLAAFARIAERKHQEIKAQGPEVHKTFHAMADNVIRPALSALNKLLMAQLVIDLGGDTLELLKTYEGLAIGEGEAIFGIPNQPRSPLADLGLSILVVGGRNPFPGMASEDNDD